MWIRFKTASGGNQEEFFPTLTAERLCDMRKAVKDAFNKAYVDEPYVIGFVPLTFVHGTLLDRGFDIGRAGLDQTLLFYAAYLPLQYAEGSWEDGPGRWRRLRGVFPSSRVPP